MVFTEGEMNCAVEEERDRCIKLLCQHCAVGRPVVRPPNIDRGLPMSGYHVLETIEGHHYHTVECMAEILRPR